MAGRVAPSVLAVALLTLCQCNGDASNRQHDTPETLATLNSKQLSTPDLRYYDGHGFPDENTVVENLEAYRPPKKMASSRSFGAYRVNVYESPGEPIGAFEVMRAGKRLYARTGHRFKIGNMLLHKNSNPLIAMGKDITGDGKPNVIVSEWTGGAHAAFYFYLFEISDDFRLLQTISAGNVRDNNDDTDRTVRFKDLDADGDIEMIVADWTFAYHFTGFAQSPAPEVILAPQNGRYYLAANLMRKPAPSAEDLRKIAAEIRDDVEAWPGWPPVRLWAEMLDLIFTGNEKVAYEFYDMAWKPGIDGKDKRLEDFRKRLATSFYWPEIEAMQKE